jgi:uncharacterized hydrophobic protein (TIGR00271 family)
MENFLKRFRLYDEKEQPELLYETISKAVPFKATNLWILIFAIFIASLGLNVNSTAVIIGAMLISPLMGPIVGIGYSAAINDSGLLRKSLINYVFALTVGFLASAVYFIMTPIHEAQSELLSRVYPTLYDVLIATFGGFAGILAACSTQKGNVVPGVAIATALMPPLCTAGYGLAELNMHYLFGALYLYLINSVFIAVATFVTVRYLRYPYKEFLNDKEKKRSQAVIVAVVLLTAIPSVYFAYDIVQKNKFNKVANEFVRNECTVIGTDVWKKNVIAEDNTIELGYINSEPSDSIVNILKYRLENVYKLKGVNLIVTTGRIKKEKEVIVSTQVSIDKQELDQLQFALDSLKLEEETSKTVYKELKALYPTLTSAYIQKTNRYTDSIIENNVHLAFLTFERSLRNEDKERIIRFLNEGYSEEKLEVIFR